MDFLLLWQRQWKIEKSYQGMWCIHHHVSFFSSMCWSAYQKNMLYFISKIRACARNAWGNYFFAMKELMRWSQGSVLFKIHGVKNLYNLIFLPCFEIFRVKVPVDSIQWISLLMQADLNFAYKTRNILHYWSVCSLSWFHKFVQPDEKLNKFTSRYRQSRADRKFLI